jgi:hypothetical protein
MMGPIERPDATPKENVMKRLIAVGALAAAAALGGCAAYEPVYGGYGGYSSYGGYGGYQPYDAYGTDGYPYAYDANPGYGYVAPPTIYFGGDYYRDNSGHQRDRGERWRDRGDRGDRGDRSFDRGQDRDGSRGRADRGGGITDRHDGTEAGGAGYIGPSSGQQYNQQ